ncbi:MAG: glucosaminidase domain-containing protein [Conexivisphaerales archaeon]
MMIRLLVLFVVVLMLFLFMRLPVSYISNRTSSYSIFSYIDGPFFIAVKDKPVYQQDSNANNSESQNAKLLSSNISPKKWYQYDGTDPQVLKSFFKDDFATVAYYIGLSCKKYNLSPSLIVAIASLESGYGKSDIAKYKKNYFGLGAYDEDPYGFATNLSKYSLQEAIDVSVGIIWKDYFASDPESLKDVARKYCPRNAESWARSVEDIKAKIERFVNSKGDKS